MSDEHAATDASNTQPNALPAPVEDEAQNQPGAGNGKPKKPKTKKSKSIGARWRASTITNQTTIILTIILCVANGIYVILAWRQLGKMSEQTTAMQGQLSIMDKQLGIMCDTLNTNRAATTAAQKAAQAAEDSVGAARKSANIAAQSFAARDRPQVFIKIAALREPPTVGKQPILDFVISNSGPVEARVRLWDISYKFDPAPFNDLLSYNTGKTASFTIAPNSDLYPGVGFDIVIRAEHITALNNRQARLFFYGRGEYKDAFGRTYPLNFCMMYGETEASVGPNKLAFCTDAIKAN